MATEQTFTDKMQTLKEVVKKALAQSKKSRVNYWFFLEYAIDGLRYIMMHVANDGREWRKVTPDSTNRINFPEDMEDFIGLYEAINGTLWSLTRRDDIVPTTTTVLSVETLDTADSEGVDITNPVDNADYIRGGVNVRGYYTVDWLHEEIIVNNVTATELVLLFKTSGVLFSATTYVYNKYIPFLIAFIMNENAKFDDGVPPQRRAELAMELQIQRQELARIESPSLYEFLDALHETTYGTAKR